MRDQSIWESLQFSQPIIHSPPIEGQTLKSEYIFFPVNMGDIQPEQALRRPRRTQVRRRGPVNEVVTFTTFWNRFQSLIRIAEEFLANRSNLLRLASDATIHANRLRVIRDRLAGMTTRVEPEVTIISILRNLWLTRQLDKSTLSWGYWETYTPS